MSALTQPIKWHGGKHYLAPKIVALMPRHMHYVEPYAGGLSVLLERDPNDKALWWSDKSGERGVSEVVNDINEHLTNFWRVLQSPAGFERLARLSQVTALSRAEFEKANAQGHDLSDDPELAAWQFFVRARQSRAGTFKGFTTLSRNRTRRGVNGNVSEWIGAVDGLPAVHARLRPVVVENMDALTIIKREDTPHTLFYLDPPYLHETRVSKDAYAHEMTREEHARLLMLLGEIAGKFMLSGYRSDLYDDAAKRWGWNRHDFDIANHAAGGGEKRRMVECLWCNF